MFLTLALGSMAAVASPKQFNIDSQGAQRSLLEFGRQSEVQILFASDQVKGVITNAVQGNYEPIDALHLLLSGTTLVASEKPGGVLVVEPQKRHSTANANPVPALDPRSSTELAQASETQGRNTKNETDVMDSKLHESDAAGIEEIVVTAQKRESTIQNTAISLSAISGDQAEARGLSSVEDLIGVVPGVSVRTAGPGQTEYEARGLSSTGGSTATVGFYIDDTPLSASATSFNGRTVIDPDLFDLNRVEVLRGPQGTLYGSGSLGGTIKLVTNQPKIGVFEGAASISGSQTADGGGTNGGGKLALNFPLTDIAALRLVVTDKYVSGWIDRKVVADPATGVFPFPRNFGNCGFYFCTRGNVAGATLRQDITGANVERFFSARAILLVKPSDALSFSTTLMYQRINADGFNAYQVPPGPTAHAIYQPYDIQEPYYDTFKLAGLSVNYSLDSVLFTSATSYWRRLVDQSQDSTEAIQNTFNLTTFIPGLFTESDPTTQFSEELRATSTTSGPLSWVAGFFYTDLRSRYFTLNQNPAFATAAACTLPFSGGNCPPGTTFNPNVGGAAANPSGIAFNSANSNTTKQEAIFGEVSYKLVPTLTLNAGVRYYKFQVNNTTDERGVDTGTGNATPTLGTASGNGSAILPKLNLSYQPTRDLNVYGTVAKGSRPGGVNIAIPFTPGLPVYCGPGSGPNFVTSQPTYYGPDEVWSFELGEKARLADRRITINGDLFYVKWNHIQQVRNLSCGFQIQTNSGEAKSYGPELEIFTKITNALTADLSAAYTKAFINAPNPTSGIAPGTSILNVPKYTGSLALTYETMLTQQLHGTARISGDYVGPGLDIAYNYQRLSPYALVNARMGIGKNAWNAYLFIANLTDRRANLTTNNTLFAYQTPGITRFSTNQPLTAGAEFTTKF